jgi:hypothetical protein
VAVAPNPLSPGCFGHIDDLAVGCCDLRGIATFSELKEHAGEAEYVERPGAISYVRTKVVSETADAIRGSVSVLRNLAIDCRRPGTSLRSTGAVTIATSGAAPTRRSRRHHRSPRPPELHRRPEPHTKMESATSSAAAARPRRLEPVALLGGAAADADRSAGARASRARGGN